MPARPASRSSWNGGTITSCSSIEDDGIGFDAATAGAPHGFGLLGMQERAALVGATLEIESQRGKGTTVLLRMAADAVAPRENDHA